MTNSRTLVTRLQHVAAKLKIAAVWNGTGLAVDAARDDYLYEIYCYFRAALVAATTFQLEVSGAIGKTRRGKAVARWPKKPGKKRNFSYLSLHDKNGKGERFQLCPGVRVNDMHGKDRAPDIILLAAGAPESPTYIHVRAIWDAKYTSTPGVRLPDTQVADFIFTYQQLGKPSTPPAWSKAMTNVEWQQSGLLTNGEASTEPTAVLGAHGVAETSRYPDGPTTTRP